MVMLSVFVAGLMATASMAGPIDAGEVFGYSTCANPDPTAEERNLWARQLEQQPPQSDDNEELTMKASFAFCCPTEADCDFEAEAKGNEELRIMNECYSICNIKWTLENATKITNDARCKTSSLDGNNQAQLEELKSINRDGGSEVCNVLYLPINEAFDPSKSRTMGRCIKPNPNDPAPQKNSVNPSGGLIVDSCVAAMDSLPGVKKAAGGPGRQQQPPPQQAAAKAGSCPAGADITTVHECGHFLSLDHVGTPPSKKLSRRQGGGTGNVMDALMRAGETYHFDLSQCPTMRQMARKRLQKGNSTDGSEDRGGQRGPRVGGPIGNPSPNAPGPSVGQNGPKKSPNGFPGGQGPPNGFPGGQGPPNGFPGNQGPPNRFPGNQGPPKGFPGDQGPPNGFPGGKGDPDNTTVSPKGPPKAQGIPKKTPKKPSSAGTGGSIPQIAPRPKPEPQSGPQTQKDPQPPSPPSSQGGPKPGTLSVGDADSFIKDMTNKLGLGF